MKAYVTSIGERTRDLCVWSLERNGFEVVLVENQGSLSAKLKHIYLQAEEDFIRVDADVVPNKYLTPKSLEELNDKEIWWIQLMTFDWYQQTSSYGGVQFIRKPAIEHLRNNIDRFLQEERPETAISRIKEFYDPRRFVSNNTIVGIHNYKNDLKRVAGVKSRRGQSSNYDFDLARRLEEL